MVASAFEQRRLNVRLIDLGIARRGRSFIAWLNEFATQPQFCYSHQWRQGDLVIWDNRSVLHRATAYDTVRHKRLMQRTTVGGDRVTTAQPVRYELAAE